MLLFDGDSPPPLPGLRSARQQITRLLLAENSLNLAEQGQLSPWNLII